MDTKKFILLVFLLFLYMLLSAIINVYKVHCNIFWSPAARTLFNYILNPIFLTIFILSFMKMILYIKENKIFHSLF